MKPIPTPELRAKDIVVRPISQADAAKIVKAVHYSGKVTMNSQLHFGVFLNGKCGGAMQFGPSLDKGRIQGLVSDTPWNGFLELNRMAFADWLPRNSESRAIAVAMRLIRKHYPHVQWIISFSDGTQCGDGTIYRASGFVLTQIKANTMVWVNEAGDKVNRMSETNQTSAKNKGGGGASMQRFKEQGYKPMKGFQLRYIYFLHDDARARLTVPELPFSDIDKMGARMYKGAAIPSAGSIEVNASDIQSEEGGSFPTPVLHSPESPPAPISPVRRRGAAIKSSPKSA